MKRFTGLFCNYRASREESAAVAYRHNVSEGDSTVGRLTRQQLQQIEQKTGTLLTHISLMIAITALLFSQNERRWQVEWLLLGELIIYLLLALLCIRCQFQFDQRIYEKSFKIINEKSDPNKNNSNEERNNIDKAMAGELLYREGLFRFTVIALYVLTFVLALTLLLPYALNALQEISGREQLEELSGGIARQLDTEVGDYPFPSLPKPNVDW